MEYVRISMMLFMGYGIVFGRTVIDMSYVLGPNSTSYPGNPPFNMTPIVRGEQPGGYWAEYYWFSTNEHRSTHTDAPIHLYRGGPHMDEIPLQNLMGPGVILRAVFEASNDSDFLITKDFIVNWESTNGRIPVKSMVLLDFGWGIRYVDFNNDMIFNTQDYENASTFHFPGMAEDGMEFLVTERKINVIGTDTPSLDFGQSTTYKSHIACFKHNVSILENLANLDKLPLKGSYVFAAPLKLQGGSGSPTRVFAILDDDKPPPCKCTNTNSASMLIYSWPLFSFLIFISS